MVKIVPIQEVFNYYHLVPPIYTNVAALIKVGVFFNQM